MLDNVVSWLVASCVSLKLVVCEVTSGENAVAITVDDGEDGGGAGVTDIVEVVSAVVDSVEGTVVVVGTADLMQQKSAAFSAKPPKSSFLPSS